MKDKWIFSFWLTTLFVVQSVSLAQGSIDFHLRGRAFIGEACDVVVIPPIAYVGTPTGLLTVDVSMPDTLILLAHHYIDLPDYIFEDANITYAEDVLFFDYGGTLLAFDVTNPIQPIEIAHHQFAAPATLGDIVVNNEYLYIGDGAQDSIRIVEFTAESQFNPMGGFAVGDVRGLFLEQDRLYVAIGFGGQLKIFNVADPSMPAQIGLYDDLEFGNNVYVRDGTAYLANGTEGLVLLDVNNPSNIQELGSYDPSTRVYNALSYDHYAITSSHGAGFKIVDVSNPASPVELGLSTPGGRQFNLVEQDLYVAQPLTYSLDGLHRFDLSDPENPARSGSLEFGHDSQNILVHNDIIYVIGYNFGVQSIADDGDYHPNGISTIFSSSSDDLTIVDDLAVLSHFGGLKIYDWSDPLSPVELSSINPSYPPQEVILRDSIIFVACGVEVSVNQFPGSFDIYDIHDPGNPQLLSSIISPLSPFFELQIEDSIAFVLDLFEGIRIFDISNLTAPEEVIVLEGDYRQLLVSDGRLYATMDQEIHIFDIEGQDGQYDIVNTYIHTAPLRFMAMDSDTLFVTSSKTVIALQTADPLELQIIGNYSLPGRIVAMDHQGKNFYFTTYRKGIFVLSYDPALGVEPGINQINLQGCFMEDLFPNPFNSQITIQYEVPLEMNLTITVYDILGRQLWTHKMIQPQIGKHMLRWNGITNDGIEVPSGVYIINLSSIASSESRKVVLLR
ncbi:MAG: T9SS type A sorting domain-containing protein [Candidatus Marinimicrobia bacterium]|nr:T9SS type A sorting domain-containing protein [Candidatus Neomarinimicrobiota bacterium]